MCCNSVNCRELEELVQQVRRMKNEGDKLQDKIDVGILYDVGRAFHFLISSNRNLTKILSNWSTKKRKNKMK